MSRPAHRLTPAEWAAKAARRDAARVEALRLMLEWPQGVPPMAVLGLNIGILYGLARDGLAREIGRDRIGDPRFEATPEGRALVEQAP